MGCGLCVVGLYNRKWASTWLKILMGIGSIELNPNPNFFDPCGLRLLFYYYYYYFFFFCNCCYIIYL